MIIRAHARPVTSQSAPRNGTKFLDFKKPIQLYDGTVKKGCSRFHLRSGEPIRSSKRQRGVTKS